MKMPAWFRRRQEVDSAAMSMKQPETDFGSPRAYHIAAVCVIVAYLVTAFIIVDDYGITTDAPQDFGIGHKYLHWYTTRHLEFADDLPVIENHPDFYNAPNVKDEPYVLWPTANIISAISCFLFFQTFEILDPIPAHNIFIPFLVSILLMGLYAFVVKYIRPDIALIAVIMLITYPRFFGHSFNNPKDIPVAVFLSLTIMSFAHWTLCKRMRWLVLSFFLWIIALTIKIEAIMVFPVLLLWQFPIIIDNIKQRNRVSFGVSTMFLLALIAVPLLYIASFPPLFPFPNTLEEFTFLTKHLWYALARGTAGHSVAHGESIGDLAQTSAWLSFDVFGHKIWNVKSIVLVSIMTPVAMGITFIVGIIYIIKNIKCNNLYFLLLLWVSIPIVRHCFPMLELYNGLRLFIWFIVPFTIISTIGIYAAARYISRRFSSITYEMIFILISTIILSINAWSIIETHPFQTTFYNKIRDVLDPNDQRKIFPDVVEYGDYWLNSFKYAGEWLDENAISDARYFSFPYPTFMKYSVSRNDLHPLTWEDMRNDLSTQNMYLIVVPYKVQQYPVILSWIDKMTLMHQEKRQGMEVYSIYYGE